jgi:hypothetical protein
MKEWRYRASPFKPWHYMQVSGRLHYSSAECAPVPTAWAPPSGLLDKEISLLPAPRIDPAHIIVTTLTTLLVFSNIISEFSTVHVSLSSSCQPKVSPGVYSNKQCRYRLQFLTSSAVFAPISILSDGFQVCDPNYHDLSFSLLNLYKVKQRLKIHV